MTCPVSLCGSLCTLFCVILLSVPGLVRSPRVHPQPCCGEWGGAVMLRTGVQVPAWGFPSAKAVWALVRCGVQSWGSGKGVSSPHTVCSLGTGENQGSVGQWVLP